jgi:hypothetical protein
MSRRFPPRQRLGTGYTGRCVMPHTQRTLAVVIVSVMLAACGSDLTILGPTPPDQGIVIFVHADYAGSSQAVNVDVHDLTKTEGPCSSGAEGEAPTWRKCVSSVRVLPGWSATLYGDEDFKGRSITLNADTPNLRDLPGPCDGSFNDCVRSIRITRQ